MKAPIDFDGMTNKQMLALARKCIRKINEDSIQQYALCERN